MNDSADHREIPRETENEEKMKRQLNLEANPTAIVESETKRNDKKQKGIAEEENEPVKETGFANLDEDLIFEVLKHVDGRTLATAACVSKQWNNTAKDERLWEMICTRHWASNPGSGSQQQLRSVVLALGGFRRLHSHCLWPLLKPPSLPSPSPSSSSSSSSSSQPPPFKAPTHWGKDEVHLSLSLLSIRYYEKMNPFYKNRS